ncbi:hypothetical protein T03_9389 [Trichinella britovi]|uniref:Secreted protein n=1 Tax=Trichinella britovi TaxID=45882 RepID=A0A0V1CHI0_TRIBR|nr:hypothetical protein T03_9389 [Trichinella britovi]
MNLRVPVACFVCLVRSLADGTGKTASFRCRKHGTTPGKPRFERTTLVTAEAVRRSKVRYVFLHQYFGHCVGLHVSERECSCPLGKVVRQDQDISVARRGLFQWPQDVHSHSLQRITRMYVPTHPGPVKSASGPGEGLPFT